MLTYVACPVARLCYQYSDLSATRDANMPYSRSPMREILHLAGDWFSANQQPALARNLRRLGCGVAVLFPQSLFRVRGDGGFTDCSPMCSMHRPQGTGDFAAGIRKVPSPPQGEGI